MPKAIEWNKMDATVTPELDTVTAFVASPLWDELLRYMQDAYAAAMQIDYSGCGGAPGWNVKFRKAGRGLCTLYPEAGWFIALVVIGQREKPEMELSLPTLSPYTQQLYARCDERMGQRWLMFRVTSDEVLRDVKHCVALRRRPK